MDKTTDKRKSTAEQRAALRQLGTHYRREGGYLDRVVVLAVTKCEECGAVCEAPNAVTAHVSPQVAVEAGLQVVGWLSELLLCEAKGGICVCEDCYTEEA